MHLRPPIRVCGFKTNAVSLLSRGFSCQSDWFPRKQVFVDWLLFSKHMVAIIQAFEQIPSACYGKKGIILSLLNKNHCVLEFITDS